jgi:hypothetical protein
MYLDIYREHIAQVSQGVEKENEIYYASALALEDVPEIDAPDIMGSLKYNLVGFEQLLSPM